jgi:hypothetical protein
MAQAKLEPGERSISLAGTDDKQRSETEPTDQEKSPLAELGLKRPEKAKEESKQTKASPLDPGIDLGE